MDLRLPGGRSDTARNGGMKGNPQQTEEEILQGEVRCKLHRRDGSEWTVTDLSLQPEGLMITAYRYVRDGRAADSRREVLDEAPLDPTDRVRCLNRRGSVLWTLGSPHAPEIVN